MPMTLPLAYDPTKPQGLTFSDATAKFRDGSDTPRAYLERCLERIEAVEPQIQALPAVNPEGARAAADTSTKRWQDGRPLSPIDGMPIGIKDLLETKDMPTQMGCEAYRGNFPKRDNAAVWALREAGAVILAKTVTAELGGAYPGPTRNPFDLERTPGGSSSGSAAAVAAGMMPTAIGTQVGGSIIRPAAYCGNIALKPSQGAINRGERQATSMSTHGVHANSIEDMWRTSIEIAKRAGGDRGMAALMGPDAPPAPARPDRLIVLESEGWAELDNETKDAFGEILSRLESAGVELLRRSNSPLVEALEQALDGAGDACSRITAWENRWAQRNLVNEHPDGVSERAQRTLAMAEAMTPVDYHQALQVRAAAQSLHASLAGLADGIVMLACPGPANPYFTDVPGEPLRPRPTGDAVFNYPSSLLFAPAVTTPLLRVDGMPVGVQFVGQHGQDARMTALAGWALGNVRPVVG